MIWRSGAVAQWRRGAVAQWRSGAVAQWRSGAVAYWRIFAAESDFGQVRSLHIVIVLAFVRMGIWWIFLHE